MSVFPDTQSVGQGSEEPGRTEAPARSHKLWLISLAVAAAVVAILATIAGFKAFSRSPATSQGQPASAGAQAGAPVQAGAAVCDSTQQSPDWVNQTDDPTTVANRMVDWVTGALVKAYRAKTSDQGKQLLDCLYARDAELTGPYSKDWHTQKLGHADDLAHFGVSAVIPDQADDHSITLSYEMQWTMKGERFDYHVDQTLRWLNNRWQIVSEHTT